MKFKILQKKLFGVFSFLLLTSLSFGATTYYVRASTGIDTNDGLTAGTAFQTLTKVFSGTPVLADGDVVNISGTFNFQVSQAITKSITIQGTDKSTTIIQGISGTTKRIFNIGGVTGTAPSQTATSNPTVTLENVTLQNSNNWIATANNQGGAIVIYSGSLIVKKCSFLNNYAYQGGAIHVSVPGGTDQTTALTVEDCYFNGNKSLRTTAALYSDGAAISASVGSSSANTNSKTNIIIRRSLFEGNISEDKASAVRLNFGSYGASTALIENCTFVSNTTVASTTNTSGSNPDNACVYFEGSGTSDNTSTGTPVCDVKLINNTIAYNTTGRAGGNAGLYVNGMYTNMVSIVNNIFYSNTISGTTTIGSISVNSAATLKESRNNITDNSTSALNFDTKTQSGYSSGNVNSVTAAQLLLAASLADNGGQTKTLALSSGSVAINAGYTTGIPAADQRGFLRDVAPDLGAYEFGAFAGINDPIRNDSKVYINSNKQLCIDLAENEGNCTVSFFNLSGMSVMKKNVLGGREIILTPEVPNGIYLVHLQSDENHFVSKIFIK